ncbi:hypothetical protein [Thauera propionica]|uniref:hypothetical protein n=1 Tax=Thauera propionica TaxID=2019431 RepID=UPI0023F0CC93|nr:hypothetical protein [Thauera propionica]MDD3676988.1 hypothetical protein [Thauera propionica]
MSPRPSAHAPIDIGTLLTQIDADPDPLHSDHTPAVWALIETGRPALPGLLNLMASSNEETRLHAQRAFEGILMAEMGFVPGRGFSTPDGEDRFRALWTGQGSYDWDADEDARERSLAAWRAWLDMDNRSASP